VDGAFIRTLRTTLVAAAAVLTLQSAVLVTPARAQYSGYSGYSQSPQSQDAAIKRAFRQVLNREPSSSELRRYRNLMIEDHWSEADIRNDLKGRSDYQRYSNNRSMDPDRIIRRAYEDILHREPDQEGLRHYRTEMIDNGWTEQDVRQALRKSAEHDAVSQSSADRIVKRAYQDILGRDPDYNGLVMYRNRIVTDGWDEYDVREALRKSPEFRQKNTMTRQKAEEIVTRAYRSVLGRDPDPAGMENYVQGVLRKHWSEADVARDLRNSDEYRNKR
jgi:TorA maturation chaperone TorD